MGYKSAAAALGKYYSALERQNAGSVNATYKLQSDIIKEKEQIKEKMEDNEREVRKQNKLRGITRGVGLVAGTIAGAITANPWAGRATAGAISGAGQIIASKGGPEKFKKDDYKFSKGIVSKQNTDIKDYKNEMGYKIAMSTISDAMTAGNMGELLGDKLNKMAAKKFQNKITDMGVKARVGQLSTDLPTDLNVIPMSDHLKKFLQKQKSTTYDFNKFGKYSY